MRPTDQERIAIEKLFCHSQIPRAQGPAMACRGHKEKHLCASGSRETPGKHGQEPFVVSAGKRKREGE